MKLIESVKRITFLKNTFVTVMVYYTINDKLLGNNLQLIIHAVSFGASVSLMEQVISVICVS